MSLVKAKDRSGRSGPSALSFYGVGDGTRTRDTRNHNPMLYQLNYTHHRTDARPVQRDDGTPEGTRTPDPLLRRQLLYPPELQARMERVMGIEPTRPAWKAGILPLNYTRMGAEPKACQPRYSSILKRECQCLFFAFQINFPCPPVRRRARKAVSRWRAESGRCPEPCPPPHGSASAGPPPSDPPAPAPSGPARSGRNPS